jgi:hypothetical protein
VNWNDSSGLGTPETTRITVKSNGWPTAEEAGPFPEGPSTPLDYSPNDRTAPSPNEDGGGGGGGGTGQTSPSAGPSPVPANPQKPAPSSPSPVIPPSPVPTNPVPSPSPPPDPWGAEKDYADRMIGTGMVAVGVGVGLELVPSGVSQMIGSGLIVGGLTVGGTGAFIRIGIFQIEQLNEGH